jgi:hypothetical protein
VLKALETPDFCFPFLVYATYLHKKKKEKQKNGAQEGKNLPSIV